LRRQDWVEEEKMQRFMMAALVVFVSGIGIGSAVGQGIVSDPSIIAGCLCEDQGIALLKARIEEARRLFDQDRAQVADLDRQLDQERARVNVAVESEVDAIREQNQHRERLYARTYDVDFPALQAAIQTYNRTAGHYAAQCASRSFDALWLAQVQATLSCQPVP